MKLSFRHRRVERGVALVITLVLLSVITFMAIAFLVLSRAERGAVTTATDQAMAKLAADAGLERAKAELLAPMIAFRNPFTYDLLVSTNYINPRGFVSTGNPLQDGSYTNVSWVYPNGNPLNANDSLQNLANLFYSPRVPVYVNVLSNGVRVPEFRYYLDLNRNGRFETNGLQPVISPIGGYYDTNGYPLPLGAAPNNVLSNWFTGDPEWVGGLEFPERPHSPTNRFLYRYAYLVVPAGNTLDINAIHNYAKQFRPGTPPGSMLLTTGDGFLRNQGVGPWEINLASFLVDLNTNLWQTNAAPYQYLWRSTPPDYTQPNRGVAFDDALWLLRYRYGGSWGNGLASVRALFGNPGVLAFENDLVDGYSRGPVMTNAWSWFDNDRIGAAVNSGWSGADNPAHVFTTQDLFNKFKLTLDQPVVPGVETFSDRLQRAGYAPDSYNRYTFYRLLSQLGTDSAPEPPDKMNLNYDNLVYRNPLGVASATNFVNWRPVDFFTNAANRLLKNAGYEFTIGQDFQIYPTNFYTPSVHQLLQLAANMYDATTLRPGNAPSVFRPIFGKRPGSSGEDIIYIAGYQEEVDARLAIPTAAPPARDLRYPADRSALAPGDLVYGVPLVIGSKKGFPNFNEFSMQTHVLVTRLLEFRRAPGQVAGPVVETNQMYVIGISNVFGMEAWNSYSNAYPRQLELIAVADMTSFMTNELGIMLHSNRVARGATVVTSIPGGARPWRGWTNTSDVGLSFVIPFHPSTNFFPFLSTSTYRQSPPSLVAQTHIFERQSGFPVPRWWLTVQTKVRFILVDRGLNRIVDYVNLSSDGDTIDLLAKLAEDGNCNTISQETYSNPGSQWCTNRLGRSTDIRVPTYGVLNQIGVSLYGATDMKSFSLDPSAGFDAESAVDGFRYNLKDWGPKYARNIGKVFYKSNVFYAPLIPYRPIYLHTTWQANDPLVHYTIGDLRDLHMTNNVNFTSESPPLNNIGQINARYSPWGGRPGGSSNPSIGDYELAAKDPLVRRPDDWEFPTNKLPNVGWLGRVHRGTPWQTVYLKPEPVKLDRWLRWTGNGQLVRNVGQINTNIVALNAWTNDAAFTHPERDRRILDLFTTAFNDNASRGRMSINQTNLAAWSAILAGVNIMPDATTNWVIEPAGVYDPAVPPPLVRFVSALNDVRRTNFNGSFRRLGDILAVPELTVKSPWLVGNTNFMSDAAIERIPQQVLGLLHCEEDPRFVVYSYGQALKPAPQSIQTGGRFMGLVTNYQVTAETVTRAVVRVDGLPNQPRVSVESYNQLAPD